MREVFKRFKLIKQYKLIPLFILILLSSVCAVIISCEDFSLNDINFGGDLRAQIKKDLAVTYTFYEYQNTTSSHIDKVFITGKTVSESSFPKYTHDDTLLVGWQYFKNPETGSTKMPSNFKTNLKNYIEYVHVGNTKESLFAVWKKKCTVTFVTNMPDVTVKPVIMPEGDILEPPKVKSPQGKFRLEGWYTDENFTYHYDFNLPVMGDFTLYAKWTEFRTITYYKNDGSNTSDWYIQNDYDLHSDAWIQDCWFGGRSGYGFLGWSKKSNSSVEDFLSANEADQYDDFFYPADILPDITEDLNLYAVWSTDVVTVTYVDSSGKFPNRIARYAKGAHVLLGRVLNDQQDWYNSLRYEWEQEGLNFAGYSPSSTRPQQLEYNPDGAYDSDGDGYYDKNFFTITANVKLYLYWDVVTFTVSFRYYDAFNNLNWFGNDQVVEWSHCAIPPDSVPLVPGKTFDNWYYAVEFAGTYMISSTQFDFSLPFTDENLKDFNPNNNRYILAFAKFTEGGNTTGQTTSSISFEESQDSDIALDSVIISGTDTITLTAPNYYSDYRWFINGVERPENDHKITIDTSTWTKGIYNVMLGFKSGSNYYSWSGIITKS